MLKTSIVSIFLVTLTSVVYGQTVDFYATDACYGDETTLINSSTSTDSIVAVLWDLDADLDFDDGSGDTVTYNFYSPGYHTVGMKIITDSGYSKAKYKQIYIGYFPKADFAFTNACVFETTKFTNLSSIEEGEIENYVWNFGDGSGESYLENPSHVYNSPDTFKVTMKAISDLGCEDSIIKTIKVYDIPTISLQFTGDTVFYEGDSLIINVVGYFDSVVWSNGYYGNTIIIKESGYYTVWVYRGSCSNSKIIPVTVKPLPEYGVTNVITPNGDGYNDEWHIAFVIYKGPCEVQVLNRWGNKVYSNSNYKNDWDGTYEGKPLQEGTYYYIIKCNDGSVHKGPINIIR